MAFGAETANLVVALKLDDSGFSGKLNSAARQLKAMDSGLSQMGRGVGKIGSGFETLATRAVIGAAAAGTAILTTAASFEQAEAGIRKTVGGTEEEVDGLIQTVRDMSRRVPLSFEELAAITAEGGALGIANKNLDEFTEIVARLAVSTDLTVDAAASSLGKLANVLHLEDEEMQDFADSLVALGNDGASTESEIIALTERFGAAGKQAGLSNEQILALASTTASMGVEAEAGGGALSRLFNNMTLDIANVTDEGETLADTLGYSFGELRARWDKDAGGVFEDLLESLSEMDKFEQANVLSSLGITNTRDINAIQLLAAGFEEYQEQLGVSVGQTTELNKESDAFFNTTAGKWDVLVNNVRLAADTLGQKLLPIANEVMDEFVGWLNDPAVQRGLEQFATDLAEGVRGLVDELKNGGFDSLIETFKGAAGVAKTAFDAFMALPADVRALLLGGIAINKATGGALGSIVSGVKDLVIGGLKTITANNVTVVGKTVTGPGGTTTATGGKGGSFLGTLGAVTIAGTALALLTEIATGVNKELNPTGFTFNELAGGRGASRVEVEGDLLTLSKEMGLSIETLQARAIPLLESGNQSWNETVNMIRENVSATKVSTSQLKSDSERLAGIATGTTSAIHTLANTPHNVNVDNHVNVTASVGVSVMNMYQARQRTATFFTQSTNSAGI